MGRQRAGSESRSVSREADGAAFFYGTKKRCILSCFKWAPVILILLLSGCAATSMMVGSSEPDLTRIHLTDQRSQVERILGKRQWRLGSADEFLLTYDVYQYDVERPARPFVGVIELGLDVISLGTLEFNVADVRKFTIVKQVAVAYDDLKFS